MRPLLPVLVVLLAVSAPSLAWGIFTVQDIPDSPADFITDTAVGDGDGDGTKEVYVAGSSGLMQFRSTSSGWVRTFVDDGIVYESVAVGDGDRDGEPEVYAGAADGLLSEFEWDGDRWVQDVMLRIDDPGFESALTIADVENDGLVELAAANGTGSVFKVYFRDGEWRRQTLADVGGAGLTLWYGDGDRDGANELYVGTSEGYVNQIQRAGGMWEVWELLHGCCPVNGVVVADADGNGLGEVYATGWDRTLHKFVRVSTGWYRQTIATFTGFPNDLATANVEGDAADELFAPADNGHLGLVRWNGGWTKSSLGEADDGSLTTAAAGDGDRDGELEVYVGTDDGDVFEYDP